MKKFVAILPLCLLGCSQPTPINSQANALPKAELRNDVLPKPLTSTSYVLAEPLAGKKVKISITAKDKTLYITNCNQDIMYAIFDSQTKQTTANFGGYACRSEDIIVPKGMTLTFIENIDDYNLLPDKTYYLTVGTISYSTSQSPIFITENLATSNEFKLLP